MAKYGNYSKFEVSISIFILFAIIGIGGLVWSQLVSEAAASFGRIESVREARFTNSRVVYSPVLSDPEDWGLDPFYVELPGLRSQNSKRFAKTTTGGKVLEGVFSSVLVQDLHYKDEISQWKDVDLFFRAENLDGIMDRHPRNTVRLSNNGISLYSKQTNKGIKWLTPFRPQFSEFKASYTEHGLIWVYEVTNFGIKGSASVYVSRGPQVYTFNYQILGGASDFVIDAKGNAVGDGFLVPRSYIIGANGIVYGASSWASIAGPRLSFTFDDSGLPLEAYPYIIDPTTILKDPDTTVIDATLRKTSSTTNSGASTTMQLGDPNGGASDTERIAIKFDTSSIDSATTVSSAVLSLYEEFAENGGPGFTIVVKLRRDWVEGDGTGGSGVTWDSYDGSSNWTTAGADDTTDDVYTITSTSLTLDGTSANGYVSWPSTAQMVTDVQGFIDGSLPNKGWKIYGANEESGASSTHSRFRSSDFASAGARPKLVIEHITVTAAVTGTLWDGVFEQEIRDGGDTIVLTLTNDTWKENQAFTDVQQDIINGLNAAESEGNGWNTEVRDNLLPGAVFRTSSTIVTITLPTTGTEIQNYFVTNDETITVLVPGSALVGSVGVTGSPTATITAALETVTVTGTLGSDGGTEQEVRDGGQTLVLTTENTTWNCCESALAAEFDGSGFLVIDDNPSLSTGDIDFTTAFWVYLGNKSSARNLVNKDAEGSGLNREYKVTYDSSADRFIAFISEDGSGWTSTRTASVFGSPPVKTWILVVFWHDSISNTINIQINDGGIDSSVYSSGVTDLAGTFSVGAAEDGSGTLVGRMAGVGFWKKVLSSTDRTALYNRGFGLLHAELTSSLLTNLEGYWNFGEVSGTRADSQGTNSLPTDTEVGSNIWDIRTGDFSRQRQGIIDGLDSAQVETGGWNTEVRDQIGVGEVVRTSDNVVTITLVGQTGYSISANETITVTVPVSGANYGDTLTGSPTFTVTPNSINVSTSVPDGAWNDDGDIGFTITGDGLTEGGSSALSLVKSGETTRSCTSISVSSGDTPLTAICSLNGAALGDWNIRVTDSFGATSSVTGGLTVFDPYSSTINGVGSSSNPDYVVSVQSGAPYFVVQQFDYVEGSFNHKVEVPLEYPRDVGLAGMFSPDTNRLVIGTDDVNNSTVLYVYEFTATGSGSIGTVVKPTSGATGSQVNDVDFSNNNVLGVVIEASPYVIAYDVDTTAAIGSFFTSTVANPSSLPPGSCSGIEFHPDNDYVALACGTSPYIQVYVWDNATPAFGAKSSNPSSLPSGVGTDIAFSPDGDYVAITLESSPYIEVYPFNDATGVIGTKVTNTTCLPEGIGRGVDWLNDIISGATAITIAHETTPFVSTCIFDLSTGTFGAEITSPSTVPGGNATSVRFHPNDDFLIVGHAISPYISVYDYNGPFTDLYRIYRGVLAFKTSALPDDATVTSASVILYGNSDESDTDFTLRLNHLQNASDPVTGGAFQSSNFSNNFGEISTSGWSTSGGNTITVSGAATAIHLDSDTFLGVQSLEDINNSAPTGDEFVTYTHTLVEGGVNAPDLIVTYSTGGTTTSVSGALASGYQLVEVGSHGVELTIDVDGNNVGIINTATVIDNSSPYSFFTEGVAKYVRYLKVTIGNTQQIWYEFNSAPGSTFPDRSGQGNDSSRLYYPETDTQALTINLGALENVGDDPELTDDEDETPPSFLGDIITPEDYFPESASSSIPFYGDSEWGLKAAADALGWEVNVLLSVLILFMGVVIGLGTALATKQPAMVVIGVSAALLVGVGIGVLGAWVLILYVIMGLTLVGISRSI